MPRWSWQDESNKSTPMGRVNSPHRSGAVAEPVIEETIELPSIARQHGCFPGGRSVNLITSGALIFGNLTSSKSLLRRPPIAKGGMSCPSPPKTIISVVA